MDRLDLVVGPNGAGKSAFIAFTLAPLLPGSLVVNADEIARQRWPKDPASHSYDAARIAADTRAKLIELCRSFIAETVFSHPSKLDFIHAARGAGFTVLAHVLLIPEDLAVERVRHRVAAGGHDVPEAKVRQRHRRLWTPVAEAIALEMLALPERPTAIFAANDVTAIRALGAARMLGMRVPHDVSVVGFDDIPESEYFSPPLTTMRQDFSELGREIMAGVLEVLKDEDSHEHTGSVPQLIVRESTAAPRA